MVVVVAIKGYSLITTKPWFNQPLDRCFFVRFFCCFSNFRVCVAIVFFLCFVLFVNVFL